MAYDITDLLEENCPDALELIPEDWWGCLSRDGRIYGLPAFLPSAMYVNLAWRQDIAEEVGVSLDDVNTLEDLTEVFAKVKEAHPEMYPLIGGNAGWGGWTGMTYAIEGVDAMGDNPLMPAGVLMGDSDTVVNLFETEEYAERMALVRDWYELRDFKPEINKLAASKGWTFDEAVVQLTAYYDGYHFSHENTISFTATVTTIFS